MLQESYGVTVVCGAEKVVEIVHPVRQHGCQDLSISSAAVLEIISALH